MGKPITHWSSSELRDAFAERRGGVDISTSTVARVLRSAQLQPHRSRYFLTSRDSYGQPLDVLGNPGSQAATHIPLDYTRPIGWPR